MAVECVSVVPMQDSNTRTWTTPRASQSGVAWSGGRLFEHVVIVVLENQDYTDVVRHPVFRRIASKGRVFSRFRGTFHPSYPNYLAMIGGRYFDTVADEQKTVKPTQPTIVNKLEAKGLTWKGYAERYPGKCFLDAQDGSALYQRKHVPFLSFASVAEQPQRCEHIVDLTSFDWKQLPNYAFVTPDMCNDGHNDKNCPGAKTRLGRAATWLSKFLEPPLREPTILDKTLVVITFDESNRYDRNHIFMAFLGGMIKTGRADTTCLDHYNVLRTIEDNFGLETLGGEDATSSPITTVWK
jgi:acid phosphatase